MHLDLDNTEKAPQQAARYAFIAVSGLLAGECPARPNSEGGAGGSGGM
jgi:hypothetical protein